MTRLLMLTLFLTIFIAFNINCALASYRFPVERMQQQFENYPNSHILAHLTNICKKARNKGHVCLDEEPSIMWHYDQVTAQCLAFKFNGCGGNGNRFDTRDDCEQACIAHPQDHSGCIARRKAHVANGRTVICDGTNAIDCPREYLCKMGAFFGVCCHARTEQLFLENLLPKCPGDKEPVQVEESSFPTPLLGKRCSDHFCPEGTKCHQKEMVAYCCANSDANPN